MEQVTITVDGQTVTAPAGATLLEAARSAGVRVPTLCRHPDQAVKGLCRVCVVEVEGMRTMPAACAQPVRPGMVVFTNSDRVRRARRLLVELILARHPLDCLRCARNGRCELQSLAADLGMREVRFPHHRRGGGLDQSTPSLVRDPDKCILCRRCVETCHEVQGAGVLYPAARGADTFIAAGADDPLGSLACALCGQCSLICPTGAIVEQDDTAAVWAALGDPARHVVVQTAPAVRVSLGEEFGLAPGTVSTGRMVAALRRLGFDRVFDTDFTADLTIMEEAHELLRRLEGGGPLPLITSCSPGWVKFVEHFYPELLPHLSSCKSPQQMFGALAKTYYAGQAGIDPAQICVVSAMPCTAKKFEARRPEMAASGYPDVDAVITTRELGRMIRQAGLDFAALPEEEFDAPLGISTGAGAIFGATGGVMEAALRTAYEVVTGRELPGIDFAPVRGLQGIKAAEVRLNGRTLRVAAAHGLANARQLLAAVQAGEPYDFIEIMACPGGCIGGGGQPAGTTHGKRLERMLAIYGVDRGMALRKSHENPAVQALYRDFLGEPLGQKSHELLHTRYTPRQWP